MANPYFNAVYYLQQNPDVFSAGYTVATAWDHYVKHGANEANVVGGTFRAPNPWFDVKYYLANNPDLVRAGITPATALDHFLTYGSTAGEDRAPNATIAAAPITEAKLLAYAKANADLQKAFGISATATTLTAAEQTSLLNHFYAYGYNETRADKPAAVTIPDVDAGKTFTLTEAVQNLVGTSGDDLFIAGVTGGAAGGPTLTAGDQIDGGAGTDTIELYGTNNAANFASAQIKNVEIVKAQVQAAGATALNVSANADVKEAWLMAGSNGANTLTLTKAQTAGLQGAVGTTAAPGAVTIVYSNASAAAGDVASLTLNAANTATAGSVTVNAVETLNLSAEGANRLGGLNGDNSLQTLNIAGAGSVNANVASTALRTVNAAENAGGATLNIVASAAQNQTVTGGSGNDTITTTWAGLTSNDKINLGAGHDALIVTDALTATTAAARGTKLQGVSNIEELGVNGAFNLGVDASLVSSGINTYSVQTTGASATLTNLANATKFLVKDGAIAASSAGLKLGANTLNVEMAGSATAASDIGTGLTVTGSTIVNVSSKGTTGVAQNELHLVVADNNTINVTGSQNLSLTVADAATTGQTINAAEFTGRLTVSGTTKADAITGGTGNDIITGTVLTNAQATAATIDWTAGALAASGADVLTGGAGNDVFGFSAATVGLTNVSTINDFSVGDALAFGLGANAGAFVSAAVNVTGAANLSDAVGLADNTANNVSWFVFESNTYVVKAGATVAAVTDDTIVKLAGVLDLSNSSLVLAATGDIFTFA